MSQTKLVRLSELLIDLIKKEGRYGETQSQVLERLLKAKLPKPKKE